MELEIENNEIKPNTPAFEINAVIEESKKELHSAPINPVKKKRGRPSSTSASTENKPLPSGVSSISSVPQLSGPSPLYPSIQAVFEFSGPTLNNLTGYEAWNLTKEQVQLLTTQLDDCSKDFLPSGLDNKWSKLALFMISASSIYGSKYFAMIELMEKQNQLPLEIKTNEIR